MCETLTHVVDEKIDVIERASRGERPLLRWVLGPFVLLMSIPVLLVWLDPVGPGVGPPAMGIVSLAIVCTGLGLTFPVRLRWAARIAAAAWGAGLWSLPLVAIEMVCSSTGSNSVSAMTLASVSTLINLGELLIVIPAASTLGTALLSFAWTGSWSWWRGIPRLEGPSVLPNGWTLDAARESWICGQRIGSPPRTFSWSLWWRELRIPTRDRWMSLDDLRIHVRRHRSLLERGRVTWGCIVQANGLLFEPGVDNCPAEVVFIEDPAASVDLERLRAIADRLGELKGTRPRDPSLRAIAEHLTDEFTRVFGLTVPASISDGLSCSLSTTYIDRRHLPNGRLSRGELPILVSEDGPRIVAVLPCRYWSELLRAWWREGD